MDELLQHLEGAVNSFIGRKAVVVVGVVLTPVVTAVAAWLQKKVGINMNTPEVVAYVAAVGGGLVLMGAKWLENRGQFERLALEVLHVVKSAEAEAGSLTEVPSAIGKGGS